MVTVVETQEGSKEKRDRSSDSLDDSKLLSPGESGRASKKRKKVKKSRSFKDAFKEKFGMTKKDKEHSEN